MNMRKTMALVLAGAMSFGLLAGCGNGGDAGSTAGTGKTITFVLSQRDEWLSTLNTAAKDAASAAGYTVNSVDAQSDTNKQIQFVETARNNGEKAIIVNLVDPNTAPDIIEAAGDMKVVFVNRLPADVSVLNENAVYVGSDEMTSGKFQGEWLAEHFKAQGKTDIRYILLNGILGQTSTTNRTKSVLEALEANGITATPASAPLACDYDRSEAMTQIGPLLSTGLAYDCIISNNDAMALGAIEALEQQHMDSTGIPIVGIDATADARAAVKDGKLSMTVFQNAKGQGSGSMQAAINLLEGKPVNEGTEYELASDNANIVWVPFEPVTAENVSTFDNR